MDRKISSALSFLSLLFSHSMLAESSAFEATSYNSELEAVIAAANTYNPLSVKEDREYFGIIFREREKFYFTVSKANRRSNSFQFKISAEQFTKATALWHTHGGIYSSHRYFSDTDTDSADRLKLPFYLADYTGYLKVFRPGDPTLSAFVARRLGLPRHNGYAIGSQVLDKFGRPVRIRVRG